MSEEVTKIPLSLNIDIDALISTNKETIQKVLSNVMDVSDASILQGTLNFSHSKLSSFILDTISYQYKLCNQIDNESDAQQLLVYEKLNSNIRSVGNVIDKVWIDMHHPAIKSYQSLFLQLSKSKDTSINNNTNNNDRNNNKKQNYNNKSKFHNSNNNINATNLPNYVEYRKLFDKFVKLVSKALDFYFTLLQTILSQYDLSVYIPVKKICSTLKIDINTIADNKDVKSLPNSNILISSIVYLIHKCVLYIGDLSRYRTLIAKTYLPSTSISKADNNNYSKSIELYKLSLLILPSLGDPYNHIAIIDNVKDDKFNVVYNFVRASLTSTPLDLAQSNLLNLLNKNSKSNTILKKFENLNGLDRQTITKNDRLCLLKSQFLVLFNYNLLPSRWRSKPGYLVSGHEIKLIEDDFYYLLSTLDFHKQIFNDFYLKQVVILLGGFELLIDPKNIENSRLKQSTTIITDYLAFMFRFLENLLKICIKICNNPNSPEQQQQQEEIDEQETSQKLSMAFSTSLLPVIRLLLCWFKEREIARVYLTRSETLANLLAILINRLISYLDDKVSIDRLKELLPSEKDWDIANILMTKPSRSRLFKEDVSLREFKPINYMLDDFDDSRFFTKDANSVLALIGESTIEDKGSTSSVTKFNDNILRLVAIIVLGKRLVLENAKNIKWIPVTASDNAVNKFIGSFMVDKNINLMIEPITINKVNFKGKEQKPKRKTVESSHSNTKSTNATTYAGSSFSNFGTVPPGSLPKLDRPNRNKSSDTFSLERPKTSSIVDNTSNNSFKKNTLKSNKDYNSKTSRRPITAPVSTPQTTDYQQNHYSRYADMVANIVNEDSKDTAITSASTGSHSNKSVINDSSNFEKNVDKSNNNEYMFKWDSGSENTGTQLNSLNSSSSQINNSHDSNLLDRFGFSNTGGAFSSIGDNTKLSSMFEINNMNSFQDTNMGVNRLNSYGSYDVNVDKFLGDSNYINSFNNLNMGLNNYMQSSLNNVNMGGVYNTSTRINDNMNMNMNMHMNMNMNRNMNVNTNTTSLNVSTDVQNAMNYMNSYNGYNNNFNNSNSQMNQFGVPPEVKSQIYGTNIHENSSDRSN